MDDLSFSTPDDDYNETLFLRLDNLKDREHLLMQPYWQEPNIQTRLRVSVFQAVLLHIADCVSEYYERTKNGTLGKSPKSTIEASAGLRWSTDLHWSRWQQRIFELRFELNWPRMQEVIDLVLSTAVFYPAPYNSNMLDDAEIALSQGIALAPRTLLCVAYPSTNKHPYPRDALANSPHVLAELCSESNREELELLALRTASNTAWLSHFNPSINAWNLAERCQEADILRDLASTLPDSALFKAWHGMELSLDEARLHPLAHALYVNKHAPVYLAEVMDLPKHWRMAMDLATTGAQFKSMLLQGQAPLQVETLPLPETFLAL